MVRTLSATLLIATMLSACGGRHATHEAPPIAVAARLSLENNEADAVDVFLGFDYVGRVPPYSRVTFLVQPGEYSLAVDVIGDGHGPVHYTTLRLRSGVETFVEFAFALLDAFVDLIFS